MKPATEEDGSTLCGVFDSLVSAFSEHKWLKASGRRLAGEDGGGEQRERENGAGRGDVESAGVGVMKRRPYHCLAGQRLPST